MPNSSIAPKDHMPTEIVVSPPAAITPSQLLEIALREGKVEQFAQLYEMQMKFEANEARKSFNYSMAAFKRNPPQLNKNKHVKFGNTEYDHATLDHVVDVITPALSAVGIRHRWETSQAEAGWVSVTCILSHEGGHSESTTLKAQVDSSGSKNAIQAIGSSITYLQRYTLLAATGLAAAGTDNDGRGRQTAGQQGAHMEDVEFLDFKAAINDAPDVNSLKAIYLGACKAAKAADDNVALREFEKLKDARKKVIA